MEESGDDDDSEGEYEGSKLIKMNGFEIDRTKTQSRVRVFISRHPDSDLAQKVNGMGKRSKAALQIRGEAVDVAMAKMSEPWRKAEVEAKMQVDSWANLRFLADWKENEDATFPLENYDYVGTTNEWKRQKMELYNRVVKARDAMRARLRAAVEATESDDETEPAAALPVAPVVEEEVMPELEPPEPEPEQPPPAVQMPAPIASEFGELSFEPNRGGDETVAQVPVTDIQDQDDPYDATRPRRSTRIASQPVAFMSDDVTHDQYESVYRAYMEKLNKFLPEQYIGELQPAVMGFGEHDRYIGKNQVQPTTVLIQGQSFGWPFPREVRDALTGDQDVDMRTQLLMMIQHALKHAESDVFFKALAIAIVFKDLVRRAVTLIYDMPPELWGSGGYDASPEQAKRIKQTLAYLDSITDNGKSWPQKNFMPYPTAFPSKIRTNCVALTSQFKWVSGHYLVMRTLLTNHNKEFEQYKDLVPEDDNKEIIFAGIKTRQDLEREKQDMLEELGGPPDEDPDHDEKAPPGIAPALAAYLQAPVPEGLPPIIIQMKPSGDSSFGMGGGVAGLVFTLWLVYNMGN